MTKGYTSGSSFLESKVQWYLYNNTVSFQPPPFSFLHRVLSILADSSFNALMAELKAGDRNERM